MWAAQALVSRLQDHRAAVWAVHCFNEIAGSPEGWRRKAVAVGRQRSPTPVDADGLAGDEGGFVGGEVGDHRGDFVRLAEAADRDRLGALAEARFQVVA